MIRAVIFDFNGVLVDDEIVHFDLFREVLAQEGVTITDHDYHERYLGYDDRGCFEPRWKTPARRSTASARRPDRGRRRATSRSPNRACGSSRTPPRRLPPWPRGPRGDLLRCLSGRRSCTPCAAWTAASRSRRSSRPRTPTSASPTPPATSSRSTPSRLQPAPRRGEAGSGSPRLPGGRGQPGGDRLGQGGRDVGRRHHPDLQRAPAPPVGSRRRHPRPGDLTPAWIDATFPVTATPCRTSPCAL